jgi:trehalose-phosphatase
MREVLERTAAAARAGHALLILADYDGTLTPTVDDPRLAALPDRMRSVLSRLSASAGCSVGVVSGRSLDELMQLVDMPELYFAGSSGLELMAAGERIVLPGVRQAAPALPPLADAIESHLRPGDGVEVERKPYGLAVHHRGADPAAVAAATEIVAELVARLEVDVRVVLGTLEIEITPLAVHHKGSAVRFFRDMLGDGRALIVYAGNDANDAPAMAAVEDLGGVTIGVGCHAPSASRHSVAAPADLAEVFEGLLAAFSQPADA